MSIFFRNTAENEDGDVVSGGEYTAKKYSAPRSLTASAARVNIKDNRETEAFKKRRQTDKWQEEAFDYLDLIGEIKFSSNIIANVISRVNLYAGYVADPSQVPARIGSIDHLEDEYKEKADSALFLLESSTGGMSGLLRKAAENLFTTGECYLVREPAKLSIGEPEKWQIRSVAELIAITNPNKRPGSPANLYAIKPRRDSEPKDYTVLPENSFIARMWRPHPRYSDEADSSMRGILDLCNDLLLITRNASGVAKSRLNNGLLFLPEGLAMEAGAPDDMDLDVTEAQVNTDTLEEDILDAFIEPISDPQSASSVAPFIIRGPSELGAAIKHIEFSRTFDPALAKQADKLLERIISGLDLPKEIVGGMSTLRGANAKIVEETMFSSHIEPLVLLICDMITIAFLRPVLRSLGYPDHIVARTVVWYDPSAVTSRPSKAESATQGYDKNIISADAWRRAHGFGVGDAPTQLEIAQKLAVAKGLISEPLAEKLIATLLPDLMGDLRKEQLQQSDPNSASALNEALGEQPGPGDEAPQEPTQDTKSQGDSGTIDDENTPPDHLMEP
jgi:hypothetical protein